MRTINRQIVSALIISKDKKVFFGKKDPNKGGVYNELFHIPGGGVDEGESLIDGLIREVKEETGIEISNSKIELLDDKGSGESLKTLKTGEEVLVKMKFNVYFVVLNDLSEDVDVRLEDDLVEYVWMNTEDINLEKHTPPTRELFNRIDIDDIVSRQDL